MEPVPERLVWALIGIFVSILICVFIGWLIACHKAREMKKEEERRIQEQYIQ